MPEAMNKDPGISLDPLSMGNNYPHPFPMDDDSIKLGTDGDEPSETPPISHDNNDNSDKQESIVGPSEPTNTSSARSTDTEKHGTPTPGSTNTDAFQTPLHTQTSSSLEHFILPINALALYG